MQKEPFHHKAVVTGRFCGKKSGKMTDEIHPLANLILVYFCFYLSTPRIAPIPFCSDYVDA